MSYRFPGPLPGVHLSLGSEAGGGGAPCLKRSHWVEGRWSAAAAGKPQSLALRLTARHARTFVGEHAGEQRERKEAERERHGSSWTGTCIGGRCCGGPGQRAAQRRAHQREEERQRCVEISPEGRENKHILVKFATCLGLPE